MSDDAPPPRREWHQEGLSSASRDRAVALVDRLDLVVASTSNTEPNR